MKESEKIRHENDILQREIEKKLDDINSLISSINEEMRG